MVSTEKGAWLNIVDKVPGMDGNKLLTLFNNAIRAMDKVERKAEALNVIAAIHKEWEARLLRFQETGKREDELPEEGMLRALGYKVGNEGEKASVRRRILDTVITGPLPPIYSPAYVAAWGLPSSRQRYAKLHRVIYSLRHKAHRDWEKARGEWTDDLIYLEETWWQQVR